MATGRKVSIYLPSDKVNLYDYMAGKVSKHNVSASEMMATALEQYSLCDFANTVLTPLAIFCIADGRFDLLYRHKDKDGQVIISTNAKGQNLYQKKMESWRKITNSTTANVPKTVYIESMPVSSNASNLPSANPVTEMVVMEELINKMRKCLKLHNVFSITEANKRLSTGFSIEELIETSIIYVDAPHKSRLRPVRSIVYEASVEKSGDIKVMSTYDDLFDYIKPRVAFAIATDINGNDLKTDAGKPVYIPCGLDVKDNIDTTNKDIYIDMDIE